MLVTERDGCHLASSPCSHVFGSHFSSLVLSFPVDEAQLLDLQWGLKTQMGEWLSVVGTSDYFRICDVVIGVDISFQVTCLCHR